MNDRYLYRAMNEQEAIENLKCYRAQSGISYPEEIEIAIKALEEVQQYRAIGTPEECRVAVEKQKAKKPIIKYKQTQDFLTEVEWKCPTCGTNYIELSPCGDWCRYCGTKLDWSDEDE